MPRHMSDDDLERASILFVGRAGQPGGRKAFAFWAAGLDRVNVCDLDGDGQSRIMAVTALARLIGGKPFEICPPGAWPATLDDI